METAYKYSSGDPCITGDVVDTPQFGRVQVKILGKGSLMLEADHYSVVIKRELVGHFMAGSEMRLVRRAGETDDHDLDLYTYMVRSDTDENPECNSGWILSGKVQDGPVTWCCWRRPRSSADPRLPADAATPSPDLVERAQACISMIEHNGGHDTHVTSLAISLLKKMSREIVALRSDLHEDVALRHAMAYELGRKNHAIEEVIRIAEDERKRALKENVDPRLASGAAACVSASITAGK